jgi:hypothetical protein
MRFRRSKQGLLLSLAAVLLGSPFATGAPPELVPKSREIELSGPSSSEAATNLNLLTPKREGLRNLENDLIKPFQSFAPQGSLDGISVPPAQAPTRSVVPNKRIKELLDRKKNWALMGPEDFIAGSTGDEVFRLPDYDENGVEKKRQSPVDRFFQSLDNKQKREFDLGESYEDERRRKPGRFGGDPVNPDEAESLKGLIASERALKNEIGDLNSKSALQPLLKPAQQDLFSLGARSSSREEIEVHKQRMNDYGNLIGLDQFNTPVESSMPVNPINPANINGWGSLFAPVRSPAPALPPGATPAALPSLSAGSANSYNIRPALEPLAPPPREAPKALPSALDFPKRKF